VLDLKHLKKNLSAGITLHEFASGTVTIYEPAPTVNTKPDCGVFPPLRLYVYGAVRRLQSQIMKWCFAAVTAHVPAIAKKIADQVVWLSNCDVKTWLHRYTLLSVYNYGMTFQRARMWKILCYWWYRPQVGFHRYCINRPESLYINSGSSMFARSWDIVEAKECSW